MITNRLGLPAALVAAISNDPYDNGHTVSVTGLIKPTQASALLRSHGSEITEDAADRIWALIGQVGHSIIERASGGLGPNVITERRYCMELPQYRAGDFIRNHPNPDSPLIVSGAVDVIETETKTVFDFKLTSGWAVISGREAGGKSDWCTQLSLLAMLAREGRYMERQDRRVQGEGQPWVFIDGPPVDIRSGKIVAIVRDWTKRQALKRDWPDQQVEVLDMDIMSDPATRLWLETRLEGMKFAFNGSDVPCTDEERWARPGQWAVFKSGNVKASKVEPTEEALSEWIFRNRAKLGATYKIEERPGTYARCADYCAAAPFCKQHQETVAAAPADDEPQP